MRAALNRRHELVPPSATIRRGGPFAAGHAAVVLACATLALRLWRGDFRGPLYYGSDALWFATVVKGLTQNGWPYEIPQLSAPFTLPAVAFPAMTNFDWAVMK